jgi:nucleotide-binding universal stress UspA family protein
MMKFTRILCPTDLSTDPDGALAYAIALARANEAKLVVCYCVRPSEIVASGVAMVGLPPHLAEVAYARSRGRVKELFEASLLRLLGPVAFAQFEWEALVVEGEEVGEIITQTASEQAIDLIVMRSRRRPHRAAVLGSTAESVCRTAPCPVLITHNDERDWQFQSDNAVSIERLLVAYDFSDYAELAFRYALSLAQEHQAELHLLHVLPRGSVSEPELSWYPLGKDSAYHEAARRLQKMIPTEVHLWCQIKTAVAEGPAYREILNYAEKNKIDLISLGAHGTGFGIRTLFGSNVDRVLRQAPCPVLVARPLRPAVSASLGDSLECGFSEVQPDPCERN